MAKAGGRRPSARTAGAARGDAAGPGAPPEVAVLVVMGVSGVGKTSIGLALADRLGWCFQEGDALHPPENVEKMRAGIPLTDDDRRPWLDTIAAVIDRWRAEGERGVVTCSALRRAYRRIIVGDRPDVRLVFPKGPELVIATRLEARTGHYMPASLLASQIATLEPPGDDERPIVVPIAEPPEAIAERVIAALGLSPDDPAR